MLFLLLLFICILLARERPDVAEEIPAGGYFRWEVQCCLHIEATASSAMSTKGAVIHYVDTIIGLCVEFLLYDWCDISSPPTFFSSAYFILYIKICSHMHSIWACVDYIVPSC